MTYPNDQFTQIAIHSPSPSLRASVSKGKQSPSTDREAAYDNLQSIILKLAVKKDDWRSAPAARTEFTHLVEQALEAYRVYMQTLPVS
jgi:hypothetical protein